MRQRTQSSERPQNPYIIENVKNGKCTILFFDDIKEVEQIDEKGKTSIIYDYALYVMENVPYRENLANIVQEKLAEWLELAKEQDKEKVGNEIKAWRNEQLEKTDFTQQVDAPFTEEKKAKYREYRQALRNIPQQEGFPYDVQYPVLGE